MRGDLVEQPPQRAFAQVDVTAARRVHSRPVNLDELTLADFEPLVGERFALRADAVGTLDVALASATTLGPRPGGRDPFTLVFSGPREPIAPQATYRFEHAALGSLELFVVPIGQDATSTSYEAIFT